MKYLIIFLFLTSCNTIDGLKLKNRKKMHIELNKSEEDIIRIALKAIKVKYPSVSENLRDWSVYYEDDIWTVGPHMEEFEVGGGVSADIDPKTKKVIRVYFSE